MTATTRKKRLWLVLFLWGALLMAGVGYGGFCATTGQGIPCILHKLTGLDCPGCGMTRAVLALARLDIAAAFGYNAIWPVILGYLLWVGLGMSAAFVKRGEAFYLPGKTWMHAVILAVILGFGILRNFI